MGDSVAICYPTTMSQPVKLSDALVLDARLAGEAVERSIAGQVEFWARLGRRSSYCSKDARCWHYAATPPLVRFQNVSGPWIPRKVGSA